MLGAMSLAVLVSVIATTLAIYVALVEGDGPAARWTQHRWFRAIALSAGLYTGVNAVLTLPVSDAAVASASRISVFAAAVHVLAWRRYAALDLRAPALRAHRALEIGLLLLAGLYMVPGVGVSGDVVAHDVSWLGVTYRVAVPTLFGRLVFALLTAYLLGTVLAYVRGVRAGERHAAHHAGALFALLLAGVNDALVASSPAAQRPLLLDIGFCAVVVGLGRVRTLRWAADIRELDEAVRERDAFVATVSHELRNPLNAILGWSELLGRAEPEGGARAKNLGRIRSNALTLSKLVEDLLDVSRLASGKLSLSPREVDLNAVVATALDVVSADATARGVRVVPELGSDVGEVRVDPARMQQIVWNLAANAVKFTPAGGRVLVRTERREDRVEITVTDDGKGIAEEHLPRIFDRFRQGEEGTHRVHGGLGLGLSVVRDLAHLHGGTVTASSDGPGRGATFVVTLPVERRVSGRERSARASRPDDTPDDERKAG